MSLQARKEATWRHPGETFTGTPDRTRTMPSIEADAVTVAYTSSRDVAAPQATLLTNAGPPA